MGVPCGNLILVLVASTHLHAESLPITATSSLPAHLQHFSERPFYIPTTTFISEAEAEQSTQHGRWFSKILSTIKNAVVGTFSSSGKTTKTRANVDGGIDSPSGNGGDIGGDDPWVPQLGGKGGWFTTNEKGKKVYIHSKGTAWKKWKKSLPPSTYARLWDVKMRRGEEFTLAVANHRKRRAATSGSGSGSAPGTGETEADCYARLSKHQARYIHATTHITRLATGAPPPLKSTFKALCHSNADVKAVAYTGFEVWESCAVRGAFRFAYDATMDCGNLARLRSYCTDKAFPAECQQTSGKAYPTVGGTKFDRGHLVPSNHFDNDAVAIRETNRMTNILPQVDLMNRGAWLETEELIECYRDLEPLRVLGGAVFTATTAADKARQAAFKKSHALQQYPSFFWKLVRGTNVNPQDNSVIAFWVPNDAAAKRGTAKNYIVSIAELERNLKKHSAVVPETFAGFTAAAKAHVPVAMWKNPAGCDKSL